MAGTETLGSVEPDTITPQEKAVLQSNAGTISFFGRVRRKFAEIGNWTRDKKLAIAAAAILIPAAAACSGQEIQAKASEQREPITPTPTVLQTETPLPSTLTPIAEEKPVPTPTQTPQLAPSPRPDLTPTPTASSTPEQAKPKGNWVTEVDPKVSGKSHFRTIEEDLAVIDGITQQFPKIGDLKIILTSGRTSEIIFPQNNLEPVTIHLGRDIFQLETKLLDELASFFDIKVNYARLVPYYTQEELDKLLSLREEIVSKYRNFPSIAKMFSPEKRGNTPLAQFTSYPDSIFLAQAIKSENANVFYPLGKPLFADFLINQLIDQYARQSQGKINDYSNLGEFLQGEKAKIDELKKSNPLFTLAFTILEENSSNFTNWQWTAGMPVTLDSKYLENYWHQVIPTFVNMALTQTLADNDQRLAAILTPDQLRLLRTNYQTLFEAVSDELFARVYSQALAGIDEPLAITYRGLIQNAFNHQ